MAMSPLAIVLVVAVAAAAATAAPVSSSAGDGATLSGVANDLLPTYGLPRGLIPDSVVSYTFDNTTGDFEIKLASTCYVWFGSHYVYYEDTIGGTLSYGAISGLSGVQAKKLFIWVYLSGMVAHPEKGTIEFRAGFISEDVPASLFQEVPVCGAGVGAAAVVRELGQLPVAEV